MHRVVQKFGDGTPLHGFTLKALQVCIDSVSVFEGEDRPF